RRVLRPGTGRAAAPAARTAALDARADRSSGAGLPAGRHPPRPGDRAFPVRGCAIGTGRAYAGIQPVGLAWLEHAAADELRRVRLRPGALRRHAQLVRPLPAGAADRRGERAAHLRTRPGAVRRGAPRAPRATPVPRPAPAGAAAAD